MNFGGVPGVVSHYVRGQRGDTQGFRTTREGKEGSSGFSHFMRDRKPAALVSPSVSSTDSFLSIHRAAF